MHHPIYGDLRAIFAKTRSKCHICATELDVDDHGLPVWLRGPEATPTIDHLTPRAFGGGNEIDNLMPACWSCNSRRRHGDAEMARYDARGTFDAPMSTTDVRVTQAVVGLSAGLAGGAAFAKKDAEGKKHFNAPAAVGCAFVAVALLELLF